MNTKLRQLRYQIVHNFSLARFFVIIAAVFFIAWTWGAISSVTRNWELESRLASRQKETEILELEVEALELENQYLASEEYQELSVRAKQNKVKAGETLVYLPKNSEAAKTRHTETTSDTQAIAETTENTRSNFEQWLYFLFHF